jgi:ribosomal protein S18 acetylase RimI-like enzyme
LVSLLSSALTTFFYVAFPLLTPLLLSSAEWGKIRLARREDLFPILNCNLRNLPENYEPVFYHQQFTAFPFLNLVVENREEFVIGYALGQVRLDSDSHKIIGGHLLSIAIDESYRRQGIGTRLMSSLHLQWAYYYPTITSIELHVRPSNESALRQYTTRYGYEISERLEGYYLDQEDALLLRLNDFPACLRSSPPSPDSDSGPTSSVYDSEGVLCFD